MENIRIFFKYHWIHFLCIKLFFQSSFWNLELDYRHEIGSLRVEDDVAIEIDANRNEFQSDYGIQKNQSLRRRMNNDDDGYNWKRYEEKFAKGSENQRSY
ncbi:exocyst complex component EXO70B1 [Trifolium repens]|nr:exocyst complex component EXO70B1 [Trifolium repens]